jgi:diguanylate cyclase
MFRHCHIDVTFRKAPASADFAEYDRGMKWRLGDWSSFVNGPMWPGVATPRLMTQTAGGCFLFGGVLVAVLATVAPSSFFDTTIQYVNASIALCVGIVALMWGQRLRLWQFHALVLIATLLITGAVADTANPALMASIATLYVFVACAAFFVAWPAEAIQLAVAVICCLTVVTISPAAPWWSGVVAAATTVAVGVVIAVHGRIAANAEVDNVTGLPNRRGSDRLLGVTIGRVESERTRFSLIVLTVDGYGAIYEEFGSPAADEVMRQIAATWRAMLEPDQILGRRGVDEFTVLLPGAAEQEAVSLSHSMRAAVSRSCSAGVTTWQPGETSALMLERVGIALRRARRSGRNRTMVESANLPSVAVELRSALGTGEVNVCYQPIVDLHSGNLTGVEALVRWSPPSHPEVAPSEIVKVAEETNLIAALGHHVLRRACLDALWMQSNAPDLRLCLNVNVSGLELVEVGYVARVFDALADTGWPADQLVLEVTESVLDVDRPSSIAALQEFRAGGVRVAIDDFGAGYSSLSRLQALPTDLIKLDASFTAAVTSLEIPPLLEAVATLAAALHLPVVAEGVETVAQVSVLRRLEFALAQGFYFGRPQTREKIVDGVRRGVDLARPTVALD